MTAYNTLDAIMGRLEHTPEHKTRQDTASVELAHTTLSDQTLQVARIEDYHDKREIQLYRSDLNDDILENPALYMGPADF